VTICISFIKFIFEFPAKSLDLKTQVNNNCCHDKFFVVLKSIKYFSIFLLVKWLFCSKNFVNLYICLPLTACLSVCLSVCLSFFQSVCLSVSLPVCLMSDYQFVYRFVCLSVCLSISHRLYFLCFPSLFSSIQSLFPCLFPITHYFWMLHCE
jgi:hypothetical protein